jgi:hypothetical protein
MTVAAGFLYDKGLAICTDTQYTGTFKIHGTKLLREEYDDGSKSLFATVGSWSYARMCVQLIQDQIKATPSGERTLSRLHQIVVTGVRVLHQEHLFKHPAQEQLAVQFLIGLWSAKSKELGFYVTEETAVVRMYGYYCAGTGQLLGDYILRPQYKRVKNTRELPKHTQREVLRMAAAALREIKNHDPNCGGDSEYVTLSRDGKMTGIQKLRATR